MRSLTPALALLVLLAPLSGCIPVLATTSGPLGPLYTNTSGPLLATSNARSTKVGRAESTGILGVAFGDASIAAAQRDGGISTIHHVDYEVTWVLGIYAKYATVVYGE